MNSLANRLLQAIHKLTDGDPTNCPPIISAFIFSAVNLYAFRSLLPS
jgi:hypothetical protein